MLPLFALLSLHADPFKTFVDECSQAVLAVKEGVWAMEGKSNKQPESSMTVTKRGDFSLVRYSAGAKTLGQIQVGPTSLLVLQPAERKFFRQTFPLPTGKPQIQPLAPLGEGEFQCQLMSDRGLVLRANPELTGGAVTRERGTEVLTLKRKKSEGSESTLTLVRDARTLLPLTLTIVTAEETTLLRFRIQARKVKDEELVIDPAVYKDWEELKPKPDTFR